MTYQPSSDDLEATRIQSPAVRDFNERLGMAYMRPPGPPPPPRPPKRFLDDPPPVPPDAGSGSSTLGNPPKTPEPLAAPASTDRSGGARRAVEQQPPDKTRRLILAAALGALLLGIPIGIAFVSVGQPESTPLHLASRPSPSPTPTPTPTPSPSSSQEEGDPVEELRTPYSCLEALDAADQAFAIIKQAMGSDLWQYRADLANIGRTYRASRDACEAQQ